MDDFVGTYARSEDPLPYNTKTASQEDAIITQALDILSRRLATNPGNPFVDPQAVKDYCRLQIAQRPYEVFGVLFLDVQNRLITFEEMFRGTLTQTSVYPREVVIACLAHKAAAVVLTHNHPSGSTAPSRADEALTHTLKTTLALVDVRVLDHIIVGHDSALSMAETGLI